MRGRVSLNDAAPMLALDASSRAIRAGDFGVENLRVTSTDNAAGGIDIDLDADELAYGARRVETVDFDAVINAGEQRFRLRMAPLGNAVSRRYERQSDRYALERTGLKGAYLSAFRKLARLNKDDPDPHPLEVFLFHSHPPIAERLARAEEA